MIIGIIYKKNQKKNLYSNDVLEDLLILGFKNVC